MTGERDPGGRFASDDHRRVLGHLAVPGDDMAWDAQGLYLRMVPDVGSDLAPAAVAAILHDLQVDGLAVCRDDGTWQMTDEGFGRLTGPNAQTENVDSSAALIAEAGRRIP